MDEKKTSTQPLASEVRDKSGHSAPLNEREWQELLAKAPLLLSLLEEPETRDQIDPDGVCERVFGPRAGRTPSKDLLQHLRVRWQNDKLPLEKVVRAFGAKALVPQIGIKRLAQHVDLPALLKQIGTSKIMPHLNKQQVATYLAQHHEDYREVLTSKQALLETLMTHDTAIRKILSSESARNKFRFVFERQVAGQLDYALPAVVVGYPRVGSNYLQSVLTHSSGLRNQSIYGRKNKFMQEEFVLTVKSHAPTPKYLLEEYARKVDGVTKPEKLILLQRDPRDVMISFYEYTQVQRGIKIKQEDFLRKTCFFYASTIDPDTERKEETAPLSVLGAFRKHVNTWYRKRPKGLDCHVVRYEDLVNTPAEAFQGVFDFLGLDCELATAFLDVKVSHYDSTRKQRGITEAWKVYPERYKVLLAQVEEDLADEIKLLGYE